MLKISSKTLLCEIDPNGAELCSLKKIKTDREYIWQADSKYWNRHSPILFPCVGRMSGDSYLYNDTRYYMQKHGFARNMQFSILSTSDSKVALRLKADNFTKSVFPFDFELDAYYSVDKNTLKIKYVVRNIGTNTMYFSLGFHPGFNTNKGDKLIFSSPETMKVPYLNGSDVSEDDSSKLSFKDTTELNLTDDLFVPGSLALEKPKSKSVSIADSDGKIYLTETFGKINMLWLWSKPLAPFVCVEPWSGSDERSECEILENKKDILSLPFGEEYTFDIDIKIH